MTGMKRHKSAGMPAGLEGWRVRNGRLRKSYGFGDFKGALGFVNLIGALAESEDHHPEIRLSWGSVEVLLWTHSMGGIGKKDFSMAGKIDRLRPR